jgi:hypothetical protein
MPGRIGKTLGATHNGRDAERFADVRPSGWSRLQVLHESHNPPGTGSGRPVATSDEARIPLLQGAYGSEPVRQDLIHFAKGALEELP